MLYMNHDEPPGSLEEWWWCSICSMHDKYREDCNCCTTGRWINKEEDVEDHELYVNDYYAWYKKNNDPESDDVRFFTTVFPNLIGMARPCS